MLVNKDEACLIISCMQKEFLPTLKNSQSLIDSCLWLIDFSSQFNIPVIILNHKNLGLPIDRFSEFSGSITSLEISTFSCLDDDHVLKLLNFIGKNHFLLAGAETHISILQSALSLTEQQKQAFVILDAVSSRNEIDHQTALKRLQQWDIPVITKEMLFFESIKNSEYPNYIDLSLKFLDQRYLRF